LTSRNDHVSYQTGSQPEHWELAEVPDLTHKNGTKKRSELRPFFTEASIVEDLEPELGDVNPKNSSKTGVFEHTHKNP